MYLDGLVELVGVVLSGAETQRRQDLLQVAARLALQFLPQVLQPKPGEAYKVRNSRRAI